MTIHSNPPSKEYKEGWDRVFRKKLNNEEPDNSDDVVEPELLDDEDTETTGDDHGD